MTTALFAPVCSITTTRRRRYMWAAWWTGPPVRAPFRKPDAYEGGARTPEEARSNAERAAGASLVEIEAIWARAWGRILIGQPPWPKSAEPTEMPTSRSQATSEGAPRSLWVILGVERTATLTEIKRAYRKKALETHPDHGGAREAFQEVLRAFELAMQRKKRPAPKSRQ
jgi:DnaJ domain